MLYEAGVSIAINQISHSLLSTLSERKGEQDEKDFSWCYTSF
jgi:hypothetical protein